VADTKTWTASRELRAGEHLVAASADGSVTVTATVVEVHARVRLQEVYNLTVADLHTYYIQTTAGDNVLVHNCGTGGAGGGPADETVLVRGGTNTADRFANGSGVTTDSEGRLQGRRLHG
jgi:hypothetical protein